MVNYDEQHANAVMLDEIATYLEEALHSIGWVKVNEITPNGCMVSYTLALAHAVQGKPKGSAH